MKALVGVKIVQEARKVVLAGGFMPLQPEEAGELFVLVHGGGPFQAR